MSKKKALPDDVGDFFEGESVFFPPSQQLEQQTALHQPQKWKVTKAQVVTPKSASEPIHAPSPKQTVQSAERPEPPRTQESVVSNTPETIPPRYHDTTTPSVVELVRKAVKRVGKEAATYRFTPDEKQHLADIVYTYGRQGYRTSENEITRIAVNWLLWDYQERGAQSVLARLLEALHE